MVLKLNPDGTLKPGLTGSADNEKLIPVFVHGWVHDIETGTVVDLNISTGPAGFENCTPSETPGAEEPATTSENDSSPNHTAEAIPKASL